MKKAVGVAAALIVLPYPELAFLLFLLWTFWEDLGNLTLKVYDDYKLFRTEKALKRSQGASVEAFYVNMLTQRSIAEREQRHQAVLIRQRRVRAIHAALARGLTWARHMAQRREAVPVPAATWEE
ncbi:MAG: hypothetical protein ACLQVG_10765 [Terriglobia bacterium]